MGSSCFLETLLRQSLLSKMSSLLKFEEKWKINEEISNQMNNLQFSWPSYLPGCRTPKENPISGIVLFRILIRNLMNVVQNQTKKIERPINFAIQFNVV